jgi:hypothetical protein
MVLVILLVVAAFMCVLFDVRRGDRRAAKAGPSRGSRPAAGSRKRPATRPTSRSQAAHKRGNGR